MGWEAQAMNGVAVDPAVHLALRFVLSSLLAWAAGHKLRDRGGFRSALARYELLPARALGAATVGVIALEIGVAAALWLPGATAIAGLAAAGLFALYAAAIGVNLARGRTQIGCGCAGVAGDHPLSAALVWRNLVLVAAALAIALPSSSRALTWLDAITVGAGVVVLVLAYAAVDGLLANAPKIAALTSRHFADEGQHA